jgi:hypothetical protein
VAVLDRRRKRLKLAAAAHVSVRGAEVAGAGLRSLALDLVHVAREVDRAVEGRLGPSAHVLGVREGVGARPGRGCARALGHALRGARQVRVREARRDGAHGGAVGLLPRQLRHVVGARLVQSRAWVDLHVDWNVSETTTKKGDIHTDRQTHRH